MGLRYGRLIASCVMAVIAGCSWGVPRPEVREVVERDWDVIGIVDRVEVPKDGGPARLRLTNGDVLRLSLAARRTPLCGMLDPTRTTTTIASNRAAVSGCAIVADLASGAVESFTTFSLEHAGTGFDGLFDVGSVEERRGGSALTESGYEFAFAVDVRFECLRNDNYGLDAFPEWHELYVDPTRGTIAVVACLYTL